MPLPLPMAPALLSGKDSTSSKCQRLRKIRKHGISVVLCLGNEPSRFMIHDHSSHLCTLIYNKDIFTYVIIYFIYLCTYALMYVLHTYTYDSIHRHTFDLSVCMRLLHCLPKRVSHSQVESVLCQFE